MTNLPHNSRMVRDDHLEKYYPYLVFPFLVLLKKILKKHILHFFTQESSLQNINIIK